MAENTPPDKGNAIADNSPPDKGKAFEKLPRPSASSSLANHFATLRRPATGITPTSCRGRLGMPGDTRFPLTRRATTAAPLRPLDSNRMSTAMNEPKLNARASTLTTASNHSTHPLDDVPFRYWPRIMQTATTPQSSITPARSNMTYEQLTERRYSEDEKELVAESQRKTHYKAELARKLQDQRGREEQARLAAQQSLPIIQPPTAAPTLPTSKGFWQERGTRFRERTKQWVQKSFLHKTSKEFNDRGKKPETPMQSTSACGSTLSQLNTMFAPHSSSGGTPASDTQTSTSTVPSVSSKPF
jgi:hypothetical protein